MKKSLQQEPLEVYVSNIFYRRIDTWQNISILSQTFCLLILKDGLSPAITSWTYRVCLSKWLSIGEFLLHESDLILSR